MSRMRLLLLLTPLVLAQPLPALAQLSGIQPVVEVGESLRQQFAQTIQAITQTLYLATELEPLTNIVVVVGITDDLATLHEILADANGLVQGVSSLQSQLETLFDTSVLPTTPETITLRYTDMREAVRKSRWYAVKVQTLVGTLSTTIDHLIGLVNGIAGIFGNKQAQQISHQLIATQAKTASISQLQQAAHQRSDMLERMADDVLRSALIEFRLKSFLEGWPGLTPGGR